jgi:hypothetical protein
LTKAHQTSQGSLAIWRCRVDEDPGHRAILVIWRQRVDALAQACRSVAAGQRELAYQRVREGMQQNIARIGEANLLGVKVTLLAPAMMGRPKFLAALDGWDSVQPVLNSLLIKLDEDALAVHL